MQGTTTFENLKIPLHNECSRGNVKKSKILQENIQPNIFKTKSLESLKLDTYGKVERTQLYQLLVLELELYGHENETGRHQSKQDYPVLREAGWGVVEGSQIKREVICPGRIQSVAVVVKPSHATTSFCSKATS